MHTRKLVLIEDGVGLDGRVQLLVLGHDVGRDDGEGQILQKVPELLVAAVELVVAEGHGVELQLVEDVGDLLALVEGVEEGALELVADVQE